jgi:hypothetical protein
MAKKKLKRHLGLLEGFLGKSQEFLDFERWLFSQLPEVQELAMERLEDDIRRRMRFKHKPIKGGKPPKKQRP